MLMMSKPSIAPLSLDTRGRRRKLGEHVDDSIEELDARQCDVGIGVEKRIGERSVDVV